MRVAFWASLWASTFLIIWPQIGTGSTDPKGVVFFVPGTLNSTVPGCHRVNSFTQAKERTPYYSCEALRAVEDEGFASFVIAHLKPTGDIEENARRTEIQIRGIYTKYFAATNLPILLIGHSAGGLYSLNAAEALAQDLPLKSILLIATPLKGTRVADLVFENAAFGKTLTSFVKHHYPIWDLRGLLHMTTENMADFVENLRLPPNLKLYSTIGLQNPSSIINFWNSNYLSPLLTFTATAFNTENDGLVSADSAFGVGVELWDTNRSPAHHERLFDMIAPLDHVEQLLNYKLFRYMGFSNTRQIKKAQSEWYRALIKKVSE